jgi:type VI secretion system secreted protein Hcp
MNRWLKVALPTAALLGGGTAVALAAIPSASDNVIHACYSTTGTGTTAGQLRVIDADANQPCAAGEATLTWNQTGPTGPQGPPGDVGPSGDSGSSGGGSFGGGSFGGSDTTSQQAGGPNADIFLKLDGISGDSTDDKHKGEIDVEAVAYDVKHSNKSTTALLRIDKVYDSSSPKLLSAAATGRHIKSGTITFRVSGGSSGSSGSSDSDFLTYKLSDIAVSSYEQGGSNPDQKPLGSLEEEVGLTAGKLAVTERSVDNSGKAKPPVNSTVEIKHVKSG